VATTARKLTGDAAVRCLVGVGDGNWESQEAALGLCGALGPTRKGGEAVSRSGIDKRRGEGKRPGATLTGGQETWHGRDATVGVSFYRREH
jgi:hypothetical protein